MSNRPLHRMCGWWTAVVLLFLYAPIVVLVVYSFNDAKLGIAWRGFTWKWYEAIFENRPLVEATVNSLIVASIATAVSVLLGTGGAWAIHRYRFPFSRVLTTLIGVPLVIPEVIIGVSLLLFFAMVNGWGNQLLAQIGLGSRHLGLGYTTVIIGHVTFCFPFVLVAVHARLRGMDPALEEAAMDLGATPLRAFWRVIVPYLMPAIVSGGLMAFMLSIDELIVTYFISGPGSTTLPLRVYGMARVGLSPVLNAVSTMLVVLTLAVVVGASYVGRRNVR